MAGIGSALATAATIGGVAIGGTSAFLSFAQAARAAREARAAGRAAAEAREEVDKQNEIIFAEARGVQKQIYENTRANLRRQQKDLLDFLKQSGQRGAAGTKAIFESGIEGEMQIGQAQEAELTAREKDIIQEQASQRAANVAMLQGDIAGAQSAMAQKEAFANQALMSGIQSGAGAVIQGIGIASELSGMRAGRQDALANINPADLTPEQLAQLKGLPGYTAGTEELNAEGVVIGGTQDSFDPNVIGQMTGKEYRKFERGLTSEQQKALYGQEIPGVFQNLATISKQNLNPFGGTGTGTAGFDASKLTPAQRNYLLMQLLQQK
jgi:hypothetical protein